MYSLYSPNKYFILPILSLYHCCNFLFFKFYFIFKLYKIVLVLPNVIFYLKENPKQLFFFYVKFLGKYF